MTRSVLVVEDEPDVRFAIVTLLAGLGWEIVEAEDGERAIELVRTGAFDAIVLDHKLPGMQGMEVARTLRWGGYRGFIVIYSAYLTPSLEQEATELGAWAVGKPDLDELLDLLTETLHSNGHTGSSAS
jgi:CheY-like chemotaxis protein